MLIHTKQTIKNETSSVCWSYFLVLLSVECNNAKNKTTCKISWNNQPVFQPPLWCFASCHVRWGWTPQPQWAYCCLLAEEQKVGTEVLLLLKIALLMPCGQEPRSSLLGTSWCKMCLCLFVANPALSKNLSMTAIFPDISKLKQFIL